MEFSPVIAAAAVVLLVSLWRSYKWGEVTLPDYASTGPLGAVTASVSIFVSLCGGFMIFSVMEIGLAGGWSGYILGAAYILALPMIAWMIYRAHSPKAGNEQDLFGMNEFVTENYGRWTLTAILGAFGLLFAAVFSGQVIALVQFVSAFGSIYDKVAIFAAIVVVIISALWFGMRSVVSNDLLQAPLVLALLVIMVWFVFGRSGELSLPSIESGFGGTPALFTIVGALTLALSFAVRPDVWSRLSKVESKNQRFAAVVAACIMIATFFAIMTTAGVTISSQEQRYGDVLAAGPGQAVATIVTEGVGFWLQIFGITAVVLALATSLDSYLNLSAISIQQFLNRASSAGSLDPAEQVNQARAVALVVVLLGVLLAIWQTSLVALMSGAFASIGVLVPVFLFARKNRQKKDWVGWGTISITAAVLLGAAPFLGETAFVPALVIGWVSFAVLLVLANGRRTVSA